MKNMNLCYLIALGNIAAIKAKASIGFSLVDLVNTLKLFSLGRHGARSWLDKRYTTNCGMRIW